MIYQLKYTPLVVLIALGLSQTFVLPQLDIERD